MVEIQRTKTFDATGTEPNGRLYAGDLNAIEDAAAGLTDLTQVIALASIQIGETGLQLLRYGVGDARLTGSLRTDAIFRALGGIILGAFTTAQRDAIAVGLAPYGIVILNTTANRLEWNAGTDVARNWLTVGQSDAVATTIAGLGTARDGKRGIIRYGTTPYDYVTMIYDATRAKWISEKIWSFHAQSQQTTLGSYPATPNWGISSGTTYGMFFRNYYAAYQAGLRPEFRISFYCTQYATNYQVSFDSANPNNAVGISNYAVGPSGSAAVNTYVITDWSAVLGVVPSAVAPDGALWTKQSTSNAPNNSAMNFMTVEMRLTS